MHHDHNWTIAGSASSLGLGLYAAASEMPGGPMLTLFGLLASIVTPVLVQWVRARHDAELAALRRQNARLFDRLARVVAERDARPRA